MSQAPLFELQAPAPWRRIDFISDLHLQAAEPRTFEAWQRYMASTPADAVVILGDLFEVWIGDDVLDAPGSDFERACADVLQATARRTAVFFLHGNRDFLVGERMARTSGLRLLPDPTVLDFAGRRWLLSHGDALCLADTDYLRFRAQVRTAEWQAAFLTRPLAERQALARSMRDASETRKQTGQGYAEVDADEAVRWLSRADATTLIHGHTHRPAVYTLDPRRQRVVLTDWDLAATPPRAEVLQLTAGGLHREPRH